MHQLVFRRQAKTRPGALRCGMCEPGCGRLCMCVKEKKKKVFELVHNSPSHLIIPVTFLCSFLLSSLSSPLLSCFQASGPAAALLKVNVFFVFFSLRLNSPHRIWPLLTCPVQVFEVILSALPVWSFFCFVLLWIFWVCAIRHCRLWIYSVQWKWGRAGVSVWGEVLGRVGGEGEMERIMEGGPCMQGCYKENSLVPYLGAFRIYFCI